MQIDAISFTHSGILQLSIYTFTFSITTNAVSIPFLGNRPNRLVDFIFISPGFAPDGAVVGVEGVPRSRIRVVMGGLGDPDGQECPSSMR
jgi:hypothetical protein